MLFPFTDRQAQVEQLHELEDVGAPSPTYASSTSSTPLPGPYTFDTPISRTPSPKPRYSLYLNQSTTSSLSESIGSRDWDTNATRDTDSPYSDTRCTYWDVEANRETGTNGNIQDILDSNLMSASDACCGICIVTVRVLAMAVLACIPIGIMALVALVVYNKIVHPKYGWAGF